MGRLSPTRMLESKALQEQAPKLSPSAIRAELRASAQATAGRAQVALAESVTVAAVRAYWRALKMDVALPELPREAGTPQETLLAATDRFGAAVAAEPAAEAAYQIGLLYTGLLPDELRADKGIYYTPPALVSRLLDQAENAGLDWRHARILDPAAGAGAFLVCAAERLVRALGPCTPAVAMQNVRARIHGYEIDAFAGWLGEVFIEAAVAGLSGETQRRSGRFITVCDSLGAEAPKTKFDLVIGNPPFGRVTLAAKQRNRYARSLFGHANLYGLFMDLAVQLVKDEGLISFLTPSSFLAGQYFKNLRALLSREAPPVSLDFVTTRKGVFEEVLQETLLATYQKGARRGRADVCFLHPRPNQPVALEPVGYFMLPRAASAPWLLPRHDGEAALAKRLRAMPARLEDWGYKVSTGPLVWNRYKPQLRDGAGKGAVPLIWAEAVTSDGRFVFRSDRRHHKPYFTLEKDDDWLVVRSPCVLLQRTTAKEQARRLIAAEMPQSFLDEHDGVTVENHLNMLIPIVPEPAISPALLATFLNTKTADRAFRCLSGSVAVSAYELENLPLPPAEDLQQRLGRTCDAASVEKAVGALYSDDGVA